jgi:tetratricopeptide (TPR) repeat protein
MPNSIMRFSFPALVLLGLSIAVVSQTSPTSLRASEVLALQAGGVLPANVAHEIGVRGLNFQPDEEFRARLTASGADAAVMTALHSAKVAAPISDAKPDKELLKQLSSVLVLMRDKRYDEAGAELSRALESSFAGPETGFVMGEVLRRKEEFQRAAQVYAEVLHQAPDFPQVHTKVSYVLYRLADPEDALHEAKLALAQNPDDAEAHKNAGLALGDEQKFDAAATEYEALSPSDWRIHDLYGQALEATQQNGMAIAEFKEAVSLDPKQSQVILELGTALEKKGDWVGALEQDKKAALTEARANGKHQLGEAFYYSTDAQEGYKAAQLRFADHVAALKAAGKSSQAADLEKHVRLMDGSAGTLQKVQLAMQNGEQEFRERRFADAEKSYTEAVKLAELLPPGDENLIGALGRLKLLSTVNSQL